MRNRSSSQMHRSICPPLVGHSPQYKSKYKSTRAVFHFVFSIQRCSMPSQCTEALLPVQGLGWGLILEFEDTAFAVPGLVSALIVTALNVDLILPSPHDSSLPIGAIILLPEH